MKPTCVELERILSHLRNLHQACARADWDTVIAEVPALDQTVRALSLPELDANDTDEINRLREIQTLYNELHHRIKTRQQHLRDELQNRQHRRRAAAAYRNHL